ncbi:MAG: M81 family metallopeptidase [Planctomycetaceae bacterium]
MPYHIAVGALLVECNHFGGIPTGLESFKRTQYLEGSELLALQEGTLGGYFEVLNGLPADYEVVPTLAATACPGGLVKDKAYGHIKSRILESIRDAMVAGKLDGVLLALHGSAASESCYDLEGDLLREVRSLVGPTVPVVATLDLHAHITEDMIGNSDVLIAWETYPHRDARETGMRGAQAIVDILSGELSPAMAMGIAPVLVGAINGTTEGGGPFAETMNLAKRLERREDVYSTSAFLVHPYLDAPAMGGGGLVVTNGDQLLADELAREIAEFYWQQRFDLEPELFGIDQAIQFGLANDGPVVLVETADCCGGGAAGDSVQLLPSLIDLGDDVPSVIPVVDQAAAAQCHAAGKGSIVTLQLGHQHDIQWGSPVQLEVEIVRLTDGCFTYEGGIWDGCEGHMGPSAVVKVAGVFICIASFPTYEWCGEQYPSLGIDVAAMKFIVAKNPMNYLMAFDYCSQLFLVLDTRGPTPASCRHLPYSQTVRPAFPWDPHLDDPVRILN